MAGFAAALPDAVARESLAAKLGPRLAVSPQAFLASVPKSAETPPESADEETGPAETLDADLTVRLLIHAALVDATARQFLAAQPDLGALLGPRTGTELLSACLQAALETPDETTIRGFLAAQPPAAQSLLAGLLLERPPANPVAIVEESLAFLRCKTLEARREALTATLRQPGLSTDEIIKLQAEIVDITHEVKQFARSL
jgi:hypothetical protein